MVSHFPWSHHLAQPRIAGTTFESTLSAWQKCLMNVVPEALMLFCSLNALCTAVNQSSFLLSSQYSEDSCDSITSSILVRRSRHPAVSPVCMHGNAVSPCQERVGVLMHDGLVYTSHMRRTIVLPLPVCCFPVLLPWFQVLVTPAFVPFEFCSGARRRHAGRALTVNQALFDSAKHLAICRLQSRQCLVLRYRTLIYGSRVSRRRSHKLIQYGTAA